MLSELRISPLFAHQFKHYDIVHRLRLVVDHLLNRAQGRSGPFLYLYLLIYDLVLGFEHAQLPG